MTNYFQVSSKVILIIDNFIDFKIKQDKKTYDNNYYYHG